MKLFNRKERHFSRGGIHPAASKLTAGTPLRPVALPGEAVVFLSQHIGAPARPVVKPKEHVERGQLIAEPGGFVSAAIHSPISGTVARIEPRRDPQGLWKDAVVITADPSAPDASPDPAAWDGAEVRSESELDSLQPEEIVRIVADAGIVGMGGASFPTHVKISIPKGKSAGVLVVNGAECEPFLTCDDTLMRGYSPAVVAGVRLLARAIGAGEAVIGIEANKPEAIRAMSDAARAYTDVRVERLRTAYPQGSEKQLVEALTGRIVPAGGLPLDAGVVVDNVATAFAVYRAARFGEGLTTRIVTVTGPALTNPGNFLAAIGTPLSELIKAAGGLPEDTGKVIAGGPMMGRAMSNIYAPLTKGQGGILVLPEARAHRTPASPCLRCASCVSVCPMGLEPYLLMAYNEAGEHTADARDHGVLNCLECGSCSYVCPSSRPILDHIRLEKMAVRKLPRE